MIKIDIPEAFKYLNEPMRFKGAYGGRGSAKSWSFAGFLPILGTRSPLKILCGREFQVSINDSVKALIDDQIYRYKLDNFYKSMKKEIIGENGTRFIFCGLKHEPQTIKSLEGIDIFWGEEANTISQASLDLLIPTIRKEGSELWFSYNRKLVDEPVHALKDRPNADFRQINYDQNPFFPEVLKKEMEYDKATDYDKYLHIWEGNPQQLSDAMVFKGKIKVECFDTPADATIYFGSDFGFSKDPAVLLRCFIVGRKLFIDFEAYEVGVDIDNLPDLFDTVPGSRRAKIIGDSARPDLISYMQRQHFKMEGAKKGKDSIIDGIEFLKNFEEIVIHERCKHSAYEFSNYMWKVDPLTGEVLPVLVDKDNHCIDSARYAIEKVRRASRFMCS